MEQQLYDPKGQLLGIAKASEHEFHQLDSVTLPHKIDIEIPQAKLQFQLVMDEQVINRPISGANTFDLPTAQLSQARPIDIADPNFVPVNAQPTTPAAAPPRTSAIPGVFARKHPRLQCVEVRKGSGSDTPRSHGLRGNARPGRSASRIPRCIANWPRSGEDVCSRRRAWEQGGLAFLDGRDTAA